MTNACGGEDIKLIGCPIVCSFVIEKYVGLNVIENFDSEPELTH